MHRPRQYRAFHTGRDDSGNILTPIQRERLIKPYLPVEPSDEQDSPYPQHLHRKRVRPAVRHLIYSILFALIHAIFSVYIRFRKAYHAVAGRVLAVMYYHHRTPEIIRRDVQGLGKVPKHLSVILQLPRDGSDKDKLESLYNDACEIVAWTASAGISMLSIYERTGALKHSPPLFHRRISRTLNSYFGPSSPHRPTVSIRVPHLPSYSPPHSPQGSIDGNFNGRSHLTVLLIDERDGRQTLVDLTKTLAEMSQHGKLSPADISSELVDAEISESVMAEPDLLITFADRVVLEGYPPWQARLTEMFCLQDNNSGVGYHVFLRALYKYVQAEFRIGT